MDIDEDVYSAELKYWKDEILNLELLITRITTDSIMIEPSNYSSRIMAIGEATLAAIDQVEYIAVHGNISDQILRSALTPTHGVYHNASCIDTSVESWKIRVTIGSTVHPGLILSNDGVNDITNLELLTATMAVGCSRHYDTILEEIKTKMSTMEL